MFIVNGSRYLIDNSSIEVEMTLKFKKLLVFVVLKPPGRCQGENRKRNGVFGAQEVICEKVQKNS